MNCLPPFEYVKAQLHLVVKGRDTRVNLSYEELLDAIRLLLRGVDVDEKWYLNTYSDVRESVANGEYASAREHFIKHGYFEGRRPCDLAVNEEWYLKNNPDVGEAVAAGAMRSGLEHFSTAGYIEGRLPGPL